MKSFRKFDFGNSDPRFSPIKFMAAIFSYPTIEICYTVITVTGMKSLGNLVTPTVPRKKLGMTCR